jgi:hypothetical protein
MLIRTMGALGDCATMASTVYQPGQITSDIVNAWYTCTASQGYSGGLQIATPAPALTTAYNPAPTSAPSNNNDWITAGPADVTPRPAALPVATPVFFNAAPDPASQIVTRTADGRLIMSTPLTPIHADQGQNNGPAAAATAALAQMPWYAWLTVAALAVQMIGRKR